LRSFASLLLVTLPRPETGTGSGKGDRPTGDHKGRPYAWKYKDKIPTIWEQVIHNFLLFGMTPSAFDFLLDRCSYFSYTNIRSW
jgi:hypothetical protein